MTEAAENQTAETSSFSIKPIPGLTTMKKDGTIVVVTPDRNVTVSGASNGVQVKAARKPAASARKPKPAFDISDDCQTGYAYGATVTVPENGPALIVTSGAVTLIRKDAAEIATATGAKEKPGIELKIGADGTTGMINGTAFDIDPSGHDVAVDADRVQIAPAAKPAADKTATKISISADFTKAALRSAGARVNITLDENGVPEVATNGKNGCVVAAIADARGADVKVAGNTTRLTLNGHVFDINTANGDVIIYGPPYTLGFKPAAVVPADMKAYQVSIGQDGKRIVLNNASVGKSADGALAIATEGVSRFKDTAAAVALAAAAAKADSERKAANKGWVLAGNSPEKDMLLYIKPVGVLNFWEAEKAAEAQRNAGITDAHVISKSEAKAITNKKDNKDPATTDRIRAAFAKACEGTARQLWTNFRWHGIPGQRTILGLTEIETGFSNGWVKQKFATVLARNVPRGAQPG